MSSAINTIQTPHLVISSWLVETRQQFLKTEAHTEMARVFNYQPGLSSNASIQKNKQAQVLRDFQERLQELISQIGLYNIPDQGSITYARTAISSAPDSIQAAAFDRAPTGLHHVEVSNLAYPQTNISAKMITTVPVSLDAGEYVFELTVGEETDSVEVNVVKTGYGADTNLDLLSKVGRAVITADDRLEAFLCLSTEPDTEDVLQDWVTLIIQAKQTGRGMTFFLSDTEGSLVETLELNRQAPAAWPAKVIYDHLGYESDSNELEIDDDRLVLRLLKPTISAETITVEKAPEALPKQSQELVARYNDLVQFLKDHSDEIKSIISNKLKSNQDDFLSDLKQIGLISLADGRLGLTNRFFQALAAEPESVREVLVGPDGFFSGVGEILQDVLDSDIRHYAQPIETISYANPVTASSSPLLARLYSTLSLIV